MNIVSHPDNFLGLMSFHQFLTATFFSEECERSEGLSHIMLLVTRSSKECYPAIFHSLDLAAEILLSGSGTFSFLFTPSMHLISRVL